MFHSGLLQVLQYERDGNENKLLGFNEVSVKRSVVKEGKILDLDQFKLLLTELFSNAMPEAIKTKKLFVSIPQYLLYSFVDDFPPHVTEEYMNRSLMDKVEKFSPVPVGELSFDYAMTANNHGASYAAYAIPKKWQERLLKACKEVDISSIEFVPEPIAVISLMPNVPVYPFALFFSYQGAVSISIFHNGLLYDSYHLGEFGENLLVDCSKCLSEFEQAQKELELKFESNLEKVFFAGFDSNQIKLIKKQFSGKKVSLEFIDGQASSLEKLMPFEASRLILFGLFNFVTRR